MLRVSNNEYNFVLLQADVGILIKSSWLLILVRLRNPRAVHVVRDLQGLPEGMLVKTKVKELVMLSLSKHLITEFIL